MNMKGLFTQQNMMGGLVAVGSLVIVDKFLAKQSPTIRAAAAAIAAPMLAGVISKDKRVTTAAAAAGIAVAAAPILSPMLAKMIPGGSQAAAAPAPAVPNKTSGYNPRPLPRPDQAPAAGRVIHGVKYSVDRSEN